MRQIVMDPMKVSGAEIDFDLNINVEGGGFEGSRSDKTCYIKSPC
ncbi:MAG: hypothetical protein IPN18_14065 [Ignavibacteriales bacterium]|nr:hypothetical protein [Ignavibacteriales bacterium]